MIEIKEGRDPWQVSMVEALQRIILKPPQGAAIALSIALYLQNKLVAPPSSHKYYSLLLQH